MKPARDKRFIFGPLILLGAFAFLLVGGMQSSTLRAIPVGELRASQASSQSHIGQRLRVVGFVGKEPVRREVDKSTPEGGAGSTQYFSVHDKDKIIAVEYRDMLPDTFKAGSPVQVDGVYYADGKLRADKVLTKCPSKYQAEEVEKAGNKRSASNDSASEIPATKISVSQN